MEEEGEGEGDGESEGVVVKKWSGVGERCKCIFPPVDANAEFHTVLDCVEGEGEGEGEGELE